jgi:hypothetical protein
LLPAQPSLWWQIDRLSAGLIDDWAIDANTKQVKIKINPQVWLAADYVRRYTIVQKLGNVARENDYDLVLEDNRQIKLAEYINTQGKWRIQPMYLGATPFRGKEGAIFGLR